MPDIVSTRSLNVMLLLLLLYSWSSEEPQWTAIIDQLLDQCPDLLYITDRLGATALDYIPLRHHEAACRYLDQRGAEKLRARDLPTTTTRNSASSSLATADTKQGAHAVIMG